MERQMRGEVLEADVPELIGESAAWRALLEQLPRVAASGLPVLLLGETGTGKELVSRAIHGRGDASRSWRRTAAPRPTR
jgi:transcriptional regulator with GAF, ATPase, and Fis domain